MKTIKVTAYIYAKVRPHGEPDISIYLESHDGWGWLGPCIGTVDLEIPIPEVDILNKNIEFLRELKAREYAEAERTAQNIEEQIRQLLVIEYKE